MTRFGGQTRNLMDLNNPQTGKRFMKLMLSLTLSMFLCTMAVANSWAQCVATTDGTGLQVQTLYAGQAIEFVAFTLTKPFKTRAGS